MKENFSSKLFSCLKFSSSVNLEIFDELIENPLSNIVELSSNLTLKEKLDFFKEMMQDLLRYAEVLLVKESNESLIIK